MIIFEVCGIEWFKDDPASRARHYREHKKRLAIIEPSPDPRFLDGLNHATFPELVTHTSPGWRQQAIYAGRRCSGVSFTMTLCNGDGMEMMTQKVHGFLFKRRQRHI